MNRIATLDAFRALAALSVVLVHYTSNYRKYYGHVFNEAYDFKYGYLGVQFFFIISGFVIFLTLKHSRSAADFLFKRFSRLYPIFWTCLFTTFAIVYIIGLPGRQKSFQTLAANLTMIPSLFGYQEIDGAYWSLVPEFFFYIAMALLFTIKRKESYMLWGIAILLLSWVNHYLFKFPVILAAIFNLKWGSLFFSGILFYKIKEKDYTNKWQIILLLVAAWLTTILNLDYLSVTERVAVSCFYIIFYLFASDKFPNITWKPLLFLGGISFPLYLLHQNIGYVIMNHTKGYLSGYPVLFITLPLLVSILLAYLAHRLIERPSITFLRSQWEKRSRQATKPITV
jgi:peptidoglycan/LPS O-acetylase OafA/YrhL